MEDKQMQSLKLLRGTCGSIPQYLKQGKETQINPGQRDNRTMKRGRKGHGGDARGRRGRGGARSEKGGREKLGDTIE